MSPTTDASDLLRRRCEELVTAEVTRLARRVEFSRPEQLRYLETALGRIIDDLVLSRALAVSGDQLTALFNLGELT
jgi:hypothetical protein